MKGRNNELLEFFVKAGKLKDLSRSGWVVQGVTKPESVADHSWRTALMAFVIAKKLRLDENKAVKMALIHDLAESETGDYMPHEISQNKKRMYERAAMCSVCRKLGKEGKELLALWEEFEFGKSKEARLVKELDRLEMSLQAVEYMKQKRAGQSLKGFIDYAEASVKSKEMKKILEDIKSYADFCVK